MKAAVIASALILTTSVSYGADPRNPSIFNSNPGSYSTQQKNIFGYEPKPQTAIPKTHVKIPKTHVATPIKPK
jgi:hypothetical protein